MDIIKIKFYNYFSLKRNASTVLKLFIIEKSRFREVKEKRNVWPFLTNFDQFNTFFLHFHPEKKTASLVSS